MDREGSARNSCNSWPLYVYAELTSGHVLASCCSCSVHSRVYVN